MYVVKYFFKIKKNIYIIFTSISHLQRFKKNHDARKTISCLFARYSVVK